MTNANKTQAERIMAWLLDGERLTPRRCMAETPPIYRLSSRISDLHKAGIPIESRIVRPKPHTKYSEYWIESAQRAKAKERYFALRRAFVSEIKTTTPHVASKAEGVSRSNGPARPENLTRDHSQGLLWADMDRPEGYY